MPTAQKLFPLRASCLRLHPRESRAHYIRHVSSQPNKPGPPFRRSNGNGAKGSKTDTVATKPSVEPSLLEELFPEEAKKMHQAPVQRKERDIPRLDLRSTIPDKPIPIRQVKSGAPEGYGGSGTTVTNNWWNTTERPETPAKPAPSPLPKAKQSVGAVLILRNASKTLIADDFTRLIPQGLHIEGWPLEQADILKIVPGRRTDTMERDDFYFILFKTRGSMNAYRKHVLQLHILAQKHTQSSLLSPIPPPPGYHMHGEDIDARLQSYTLLTPTQHMRMMPMADDARTPYLDDIVRNLGYPDIVNGPFQEPFVVMMRLEGPQLGMTTVRRALFKVEKMRRIPWDVDFRTLTSHVWTAKAKNLSPMSRSRLEKIPRDGREGREEDEQADEREQRSVGKRERRQKRAAYLFGFSTEEKAQTFVQYWHRRPLDLPEDILFENDETAPVVEAELLW